jgi:hypothetical protein
MNARKLVYVKCRNGHWYHDTDCPVDGYSDELTRRIDAAVNRLLEQGGALTFAAVIEAAELTERQSRRFMIVESAIEGEEPKIFTECSD